MPRAWGELSLYHKLLRFTRMMHIHKKDETGMPVIGKKENRVREGGEQLHKPRRCLDG